MKQGTLIVITLLLLVSTGLGQRGGTERPPGGGGGGGGGGSKPPADPAIVYRDSGGSPGGSTPLFVMNEDGSNKAQVTSAGHDPSWSPDGRSIAFGNVCQLMRIDVAVVGGVPQGSPPTRLDQGDCGCCGHAAWSPVGDEIAVDGGFASGYTQIFVIPAGGGGAQTVYTPPAGRRALYPTWSPDATRVAFVEQNTTSPRDPVIMILDYTTGTVTNVLLQGQFTEPMVLVENRTVGQ